MTPMEIALLTNAALDIITMLQKSGAQDAITADNLDDKLARRQSEVDAIDKLVNA